MPQHTEKPLDPQASSELRIQLHARFHEALVRFFRRRIRTDHYSEDLAQETLLRVLKAGAFDRVESPERYVFRVAINQLRDHQRKVGRLDHPGLRINVEEAIASEKEPELVEVFYPERVVASRDSLQHVAALLSELDDRTRNIFVLFKLEGMKQKQIAELYGIGQSTVEKHVMKATAHLIGRQQAMEHE
ncbi:RNA polymerase sigma factor [Steroidobacter sp.]|uniref:RNA polymerase sigma factor n=1 Tax=Steroidobacter sp. TaxID=1978227 RepID=UPI001A57C3A7|nr:sigma-70 family RNA polymerase sigma factor [Steroidobacter sp.]MBL8267995.1 sigma-70 family RNA polymerase sigma factor [Steroidobacter sp.]